MPCCCFLFLSFFLSPVWKQGKNNQNICMTCMCLVKVQLESRGVSAAAWAVFRAAATLRLLAQRAAPATASKAAPKGSPPSHSMLCTHLHKQLLFSSCSCLLQLRVACGDDAVSGKRSSSQLRSDSGSNLRALGAVKSLWGTQSSEAVK